MKIVAINGSPHKKGNTYAAINAAAKVLEKHGGETEIICVGDKNIRGCISCGYCYKAGECVFKEDLVNETAALMREADGIIIGSPVYYSGVNGTLKSFLDRVFYSSGKEFSYKVGGAITAVRRAGGVPAFQQINNYFNLTQMLIAPTFYWSVAYGQKGQESLEDGEGIQGVEVMAENMAWLIKTTKFSQIPKPDPVEKRIRTNFIR